MTKNALVNHSRILIDLIESEQTTEACLFQIYRINVSSEVDDMLISNKVIKRLHLEEKEQIDIKVILEEVQYHWRMVEAIVPFMKDCSIDIMVDLLEKTGYQRDVYQKMDEHLVVDTYTIEKEESAMSIIRSHKYQALVCLLLIKKTPITSKEKLDEIIEYQKDADVLTEIFQRFS